MDRKISVLPTMITLGNLVCGFMSIVYAAEGEFVLAGFLILLAMVFDMLDGQVARMTNTAGEFGGELDSLCDVISFGLAPAMLINRMGLYPDNPILPEKVIWLCSILYVAFAALRLARFNIETTAEAEDHEGFIGLPSPAAAGVVATLVIFDSWVGGNPLSWILPLIGLGAGALMVSRVPYVHMGNRLFKGGHRFRRFLLLLCLAIMIVLRPEIGLMSLFVSYMLYGLVQSYLTDTDEPAPAMATGGDKTK